MAAKDEIKAKKDAKNDINRAKQYERKLEVWIRQARFSNTLWGNVTPDAKLL